MSIVWRDKVLSSYNGNIESVLIVKDATVDEPVAVEAKNGVFVTLAGLAGKGREVKYAELGADADGDALLVASPEVLYEAGKEIDDFVNEKGKVARAFRLADGDVITLTEDLLKNVPNGSVGQEFVVGTDGLLTTEGANPTEGEAPVLKFKVRENAGHELTRKRNAWRFDIVK